MSWILRMPVPEGETSLVADRLWTLGASGIADEIANQTMALVIAGFDREADAISAGQEFVDYTPTVEPFVDEWTGPEAKTLTVAGSQIQIESGHAFGHGYHPTTALLFRWLADIDLARQSFLDVGTGTGILAIAATKLGAKPVVAVDNDQAALAIAATNAATNGADVELSGTDVAQLTRSFAVVVANMLLPQLLTVAPDLVRLSASTLLIAGILDTQVDQIVEALRPLELIETRSQGEWRALRLVRQ